MGTVGFSRVALGVHSLNQVVYGWSYGLWLAFFMFRFVWPTLKDHIRTLLDHPSTLKHYTSYYFYLALLIWATLIVFSLFNFLVARRDFPLPPP